jgi:fatty acid desaturase
MYFSMPSMRRSRHPLVRALSLLVGVVLIGVLLVFGLVVASVLLVGGALLLGWRQWKHGRTLARQPAATRATHQADVLEGEFVVIQQGRPVAH